MTMLYSVNRDIGDTIRDPFFLETYCKLEGQDISLVKDVIESQNRLECYIVDNQGVTGCIMLTLCTDMHHGLICCVLAEYILPEYRTHKYLRDVVDVIKKYCKKNNVTKYQRSVHISPTTQLLKTKEV